MYFEKVVVASMTLYLAVFRKHEARISFKLVVGVKIVSQVAANPLHRVMVPIEPCLLWHCRLYHRLP